MGFERIRIAYLIADFEASRHGRHLLALLKALPDERFEKHALCMRPDGILGDDARRLAHGVHDLGWPPFKAGDRVLFENMPKAVAAAPRAAKALKTIRPDILHCLSPAGIALGAVAGKLARIQCRVASRIIAEPHSDHNPAAGWLNNKLSSAYHLIRCDSEAAKGDMAGREPTTFEKMRVVYDGISIAKYCAQAPTEQLRTELGIPLQAPVIGAIGNLVPHRGYGDLITAASLAANQAPNAWFLIVGRDEGSRFELLQQARQLGVSDRVVFAGERADAHQLLQCMNLYVSSAHFEGFPSEILEAMATALPVIATRVGGNPEVVDDHETGLLVAPQKPDVLAQRILELIYDKDRAYEMGLKGRRRANDSFSLEAMARSMDAFCKEALSRSTA